MKGLNVQEALYGKWSVEECRDYVYSGMFFLLWA